MSSGDEEILGSYLKKRARVATHETLDIAATSAAASGSKRRRITRNVVKAARKPAKKVIDKAASKPSKKNVSAKHLPKAGRVGSKFTSIFYRTTPGKFAKMMSSLSPAQKKDVLEMGFGGLIGFSIEQLPPKMVYYVVDSFDSERMVIKTSKGDIKCDREAVFDVLGLSRIGKVPFFSEWKVDSEFKKEWEAQFKDPKSIRMEELVEVIRCSKGAVDKFFRANFLMVFYGTMINSDSNGTLYDDVVRHVNTESKVADIDWAGELLNRLQFSKLKWNRLCPKKNAYVGPAIFLTLLYVDRTMVDDEVECRLRPAFKNWSFGSLKLRESKEMALGNFGLLQVRDVQSNNPDVSNSKKVFMKIFDDHLNVAASIKTVLLNTMREYVENFGEDSLFQEVQRKAMDIISFNENVPDLMNVFDARDGNDFDPNDVINKVVDDIQQESNDGNDYRFENADSVEADDGDDGDDGVHATESESVLDKDDVNANDVDDDDVNVDFDATQVDSVVDKDDVDDDDVDATEAAGRDDVVDGTEGFGGVHNEDKDDGDAGEGDGAIHKDDMGDGVAVEGNDGVGNAEAADAAANLDNDELAEDDEEHKDEDKGKDDNDGATPQNVLRVFGKRKVKPSAALKSPYVNKKTDVDSKTIQCELAVAMDLFSALKDKETIVFSAPNIRGRPFGIRLNLESLCPGLYVDSVVVDIWASLLNYEERYKSSSLRRVFFPTSIFAEQLFQAKNKKEKDASYQIWSESFSSFIGVEDFSLKHVDLVFFPILRHSHYYVLVFDLRNDTAFHIIDNMVKNDPSIFRSKYVKVCSSVRYVFARHLKEQNHRAATLVASLKPVQMDISWKTKSNYADCGVFAMCHMEKYMGEAEGKWDAGLKEEGQGQEKILQNMRLRYATKILTHDINIHASEVDVSAKEFCKRFKSKDFKKLIDDAKSNREERIK